jgi:hypothetical protein
LLCHRQHIINLVESVIAPGVQTDQKGPLFFGWGFEEQGWLHGTIQGGFDE